MPKGDSGKSNGVNASGYGNIKTIDPVGLTNEQIKDVGLFIRSSEDYITIIPVKSMTVGSEKQLDYANAIKVQQMQEIDKFASTQMGRPGAVKPLLKALRNEAMYDLNKNTDARSILDGKSKSGELIFRGYLTPENISKHKKALNL